MAKVEWDAATKSAGVGLYDWNGDNLNTGAYWASANGGVKAAGTMRSTGKYKYAVLVYDKDYVSVGLVTAGASISSLNVTGQHFWYFNSGTVYSGASGHSTGVVPAVGDYVVVAVDFDAGKIWFGLYDESLDVSSWIEGDPSAGTTPSLTFTPNTPLCPFAYFSSVSSNGGDVEADFAMRLVPDPSKYPATDATFVTWNGSETYEVAAIDTPVLFDSFGGVPVDDAVEDIAAGRGDSGIVDTDALSESSSTTEAWSSLKVICHTYVWGANNYSQLGTNDVVVKNSPQRLLYDFGPHPIVNQTSENVTLLTRYGELYAWGRNLSGVLGLGGAAANPIPVPTQIAGDWTDARIWFLNSLYDASLIYVAAIKADGTLWLWGSGFTEPTQIAGDWTGAEVIFPEGLVNANVWVRKADGTLWARGANAAGILGIGTTTSTTTMTQVTGDWTGAVFRIGGASTIYQTMYALFPNGNLYAWGYNGFGACGNGGTGEVSSPYQIPGTWARIDVSHKAYLYYGFAFGIKTDGTLWSWGSNYNGQGGRPSGSANGVPTQIAGSWHNAIITRILNSSFYHTVVAIDDAGALWTWGYGFNGLLGNGTTTTSYTPIQVFASGWSNATIAAVPANTAAFLGINAAGEAWTWGSDRVAPAAAVATNLPWQLTGSWPGAMSLRLGSASAYLRDAANNIWAWGSNTYGQLGLGDTTARDNPTQVTGDWTGDSISALSSLDTKLAVKPTAVHSWGRNGYSSTNSGVLGLGLAAYTDTATSPTAVLELLDVTTLYLTTTGSVMAVVQEEYVPAEIDVLEAAGSADAVVVSNITSSSYADSGAGTGSAMHVTHPQAAIVSGGALGDALVWETITWMHESILAAGGYAPQSITASNAVSGGVIRDGLYAAFADLVTDFVTGADTWFVTAGVRILDLMTAAGTVASSTVLTQALAEAVVTLEAFNSGAAEDIAEGVTAIDTYAQRVLAVVAVLESHYIQDVNVATVTVYQPVSDSANAAILATHAGSLLTAVLNDTTLATIRLNIGGELFTGWVMNTDTLATSEYQFADLSFNSACKHGDRYLMAADDGIYAFTEARGVESVMTYIKTGKMDFGSDLKKRVVNSYMVYSATGQMVLKVTTSEFGQLVTRNYKMVPPSDSETADTRRFDLGKGIRSRYWQFELVGDGVDCDIDEIGMLPVLLSRRI